MTVKVHDYYWECDYIIHDVVKIIDRSYGFILVKKDGFLKEYTRECSYRILVEGESRC